MNAKNLPMKFAFVAALLLLALWGTFSKKAKLGIDLRGGHALIFEIMTNETEIRRLEGRQAALRDQVAQAKDDAARKGLQSQLQVLEGQLANLKRSGSDRGDLADQIISHLKERIDPRGFFNLEMRPLGTSRIEIRMPMGDKQSKEAANDYDDRRDSLEKGNLHRSEIYRVVDSQGPDRQAQIKALSGSDANRADLLSLYAETMDEAAKARAEIRRLGAELDQFPPTTQPQGPQKDLEEQRGKALEALAAAQSRGDALNERLEQANVTIAALVNILRNYVPPRELAAGKEKKQLEQRLQLFQVGLDRLRAEHPSRLKDIDEAVRAYQAWAQARQRLDDPDDLVRLVRNAGVLEFRIAPEPHPAESRIADISEEEVRRYMQLLQDPTEGPDSLRRRNDKFIWFPVHPGEDLSGGLVTADAHGRSYVLLYNQPGWMMLQKRGPGGWTLTSAYPSMDENVRPSVAFEFDENGARVFSELTGTHLKRFMAILLDDEVYSAPVIQSRISSRGQITGTFSREDVSMLSRTLQAGSLPAKLNPVPIAQSTFGPAFGEINLRAALRAGYWSALFVMGFMLVYYLLSGMIANAALAMNLLMVIGAMGFFDAVFTLPGIAGMILVIGMAVDANVLIYERLREEQAKGQSIRMALKNAYDRAFSAIFDSNITTLISAAILGWVGTEEIRGFAITLGLGVAFNIFTAVYVTRWIFQALLEAGWLKRPLRMLKVIGVPKVDWMGMRYYFWAFSIAMLVLGVASIVWQGRNILGVEFSGGTQAVVTFREGALIGGKLPDDGLVRGLFAAKAGRNDKLTTARVEKVDTDRVSNFLKDHDTNSDGKVTLAEWTAQRPPLDPDYFRQVSARAKSGDSLSRADLDRHLPAKSYQIATTETEAPLIRKVVADAFGEALAERNRIDFDLEMGQAQPILGVDLSADGRTLITKELAEKADPRRRPTLLDAEGGVLMLVRLQTPSTQADVVARLRDVGFQPDFQSLATNSIQVIGLTPAAKPEEYSEFAIVVRPGDPAIAGNPRVWGEFAQQEYKLLEEALHRQEAMVATNFDPAVAGQAKQLAVVAMVLAWAAIIVYLWARFGQFRWGLAAVLCLIHDVTVTAGMVAVSGWLHATWIGQALGVDSFKMDLTMIAALLTIIGYSVNDTIVVFDRIRENRGRLVVVTPQIINASVNQTLSRTFLTNMTVMAVVFIMYIFGGQGIHAFSYAMVVGALIGTYSTVAVAAPMLLGFKEMMAVHPGAVADAAK